MNNDCNYRSAFQKRKKYEKKLFVCFDNVILKYPKLLRYSWTRLRCLKMSAVATSGWAPLLWKTGRLLQKPNPIKPEKGRLSSQAPLTTYGLSHGNTSAILLIISTIFFLTQAYKTQERCHRCSYWFHLCWRTNIYFSHFWIRVPTTPFCS